ncbi:MAG: hypothetical protein LAQ69_30600 [Acidobacteriia bacterium]|nr:hypothetical protein [Terriglobia bacterium]
MEDLSESIMRLIRYRRAPPEATTIFRAWKHDKDILPKLQFQLEMVVESYGKFEPIVHNTQCIRDDGTDVVLRYRPENDATASDALIGFQVKSFGDLTNRKYIQELKAQHYDSFQKVIGLRQYYILLCTSMEDHRRKVQSIAAEFRSTPHTQIIEPAFAYTFLHHPRTRVEAIVKRSLEDKDIVLKLAMEIVELASPSARALVIFLVIQFVLAGTTHFAIHQLLEAAALQEIFRNLGEQQNISERREFEVQVAEDLDMLDAGLIEIEPDSEHVTLRAEQVRAVTAIVADALARYEHDEQHLMAYMFSLLGVWD